MARNVVISGLGAISGLGIGIDAHWEAACAGRSAVGPITAFDPSESVCRVGAQAPEFKVNNYVPKSYRKAVKVMARDIELAVVAADLAARDARLATKGNLEAGQGEPSYPAPRLGVNIGASLIACELDELTAALTTARKEDDPATLDLHRWGSAGMQQLTPLWLLKYLPNMLACHVTIIHDAQGPSNTITCSEASSGLSLGEALRVIERGAADASLCGGGESKLNPMAHLRQELQGRLTPTGNDRPAQAVRPFAADADGMVTGEGAGIVVLEALDTFTQRCATPGIPAPGAAAPRAYARVAGFGASQTVHPATRNLTPDPAGRSIALAIRAALREAGIEPGQVDLIFPMGDGEPAFDRAEWAALTTVFGDRLAQIPVVSTKPLLGNCGAAAGALDVALAAKALSTQTIPAIVNTPWAAPSRSARLDYALVCSTSLGGQNTAVVLQKA